MCEYCEGYKEVIDKWERPYDDRGYMDYTEEVKGCSLYQNEDSEGNGYEVVFGDGTVYEFLSPCVVDHLPFRFCPMCGRDLKAKGNAKPQVADSAANDKTVYCVTLTDILTDDEVCVFYDTLEEAKYAAEADSSCDGETIYIHELKKGRIFRTEPVVTYETVEFQR